MKVSDLSHELVTCLEEWAPGIVGNPYIPHWPWPKQWVFLGLHRADIRTNPPAVFEALYGGSAGGGKSDALLMAVAQYAWQHGEFSAACFRRSFQDLINPGALLDRAMEWWIPAGVEWNGSKSMFTFPSGAKVKMSHMSQPEAHLDHQGAEYHLTVWDELTQHPTSRQYEYVGISRVRRKEGCPIPLRTLSTSNPGGPGHSWVKRRFVGGVDLETGQRIEPEHLYVPARIADNPALDRETYVSTLSHLHPTLRAQLLEGNWDAREPGDYFRREWFGPLLDPEVDHVPASDCIRVRWWDLAASERDDAARTAGVKMLRLASGVRAIEHAVAFRATPGKRDGLIVQTAQADGRGVIVGIEIEPGSGGIAQFETLSARLRAIGCQVVGWRPTSEMDLQAERKMVARLPTNEKGKAARAGPVASCLERGYARRGECPDTRDPWWGADMGRPFREQRDGLRLYAGPWTAEYLDEVEGAFEAEPFDLADATVAAWAWLEAHPFGRQRPPDITTKETPRAEVPNVHPLDRDRTRDTPKRWIP